MIDLTDLAEERVARPALVRNGPEPIRNLPDPVPHRPRASSSGGRAAEGPALFDKPEGYVRQLSAPGSPMPKAQPMALGGRRPFWERLFRSIRSA